MKQVFDMKQIQKEAVALARKNLIAKFAHKLEEDFMKALRQQNETKQQEIEDVLQTNTDINE